MNEKHLPKDLRGILGSLNCDSLNFEIGDTIEGKPDHHFHTQFYFQKLEIDSLVFDYQVSGWHIGDSRNSIDKGRIKLKCLK